MSAAGSHTLVSASPDDAIVRVFNFETQGNYTLELPDISHSAGSMRRSPDTITALAYHARDNCLAIGTLTGSLHCFQHLHENRCALCCGCPPWNGSPQMIEWL